MDSAEFAIDRRRYRRIIWFFARVVAHLIWWDVLLGRVARRHVRATRPARFRRLSRRFREVAVTMGGVLIKLGQFLSARVDVLPVEVTEELAGLQDEVPPVPWIHVHAVLEAELGSLTNHFAHFEETPLAAASLGQAHRAWLRPRAATPASDSRGPAVVVKVLRPGIEQIVETDLAALRVVARWAMRYKPIRRRADMPALMDEFTATLREELDYHLEAANAERFAEMFAADESVQIPFVYRRHSTGRVLSLENVEGIKITDVEGMRAAGIDPKQVAAGLLDTYFKQIFEEGFFHADPHPGNLFVQPLPMAENVTVRGGHRPFRLTFVDFGMVGRVPALMGENMRRVLVAVAQRDARALTQAYNDLGFFLPGSDLERITEVQAVLLDRLWGRNLLEMGRPDPAEIQELGREFRDILFAFPFQIPHDFIYLGRTFGMLSGLSSVLDPEINPWYQVESFARRLVDQADVRRAGWEAVLAWLRPLVALPAQMERVLVAAESGRLKVQTALDRDTARRLERLEKRVNRLSWSLLAAAAVVSGTFLYLGGEEIAAGVAWGVSGLYGLWLLTRRE